MNICVEEDMIFLKGQYMTLFVNYEKRKNNKLFENLVNFDCHSTQNYIPIYQNFFNLNESNYNNINLNNNFYIHNVTEKIDENHYICLITNGDIRNKEEVFFKFAPLIDPVKVMIGKYQNDSTFMSLPQLESTSENVNNKILDVNNSAYVDGMFSYLSNQILVNNNFIHGLRFYGSFLTIKKNYKVNVYDDLEYLIKSDYFNRNKNKLFTIEDYSMYFDDDNASRNNLPAIKINDDIELGEIEQLDNNMFENVFFDKPNEEENSEQLEEIESIALTEENIQEHNNLSNKNSITKSSSSSCSSRTSHTESNDVCDDDSECNDSKNSNDTGSSEYTDESDEILYATFPKYPVQMICMENCENTLDQLIADDELNESKWLAALMQIIMTLICYQKILSFTHNDLHTNNIMYVKTKKKFLFYKVNNTYYRVPTYGKIFKIIDFGRAIYKYNGKIMCSDSFSPGGDAATQYNIEPYYNNNKPRLEPNYSFDLCRLACSIFDYLVEDMSEIKDISKCDTITRIITEWCIDDNGIHMLYKNNGVDRYPDFKLYKMIARCVHNHTPISQLSRKEFNAFSYSKNKIPKNEHIMDIDKMDKL